MYAVLIDRTFTSYFIYFYGAEGEIRTREACAPHYKCGPVDQTTVTSAHIQ